MLLQKYSIISPNAIWRVSLGSPLFVLCLYVIILLMALFLVLTSVTFNVYLFYLHPSTDNHNWLSDFVLDYERPIHINSNLMAEMWVCA